jgi:mgtE-like transporter
VALLGPDATSAGQSLVALAINSSTSLVAGAVLGSITDTFARYPGLLVMVPAAIGLRGNVFSALGSRLSTAIHAGTYTSSWRRGTVLGDNIAASLVLTVGLALALAVVAKAVAVAFGVADTISVLDLATISIVGGLLASLVVLAATLVLVVLGVRYEWDLDNLVAPVVSTLGDVVTVPALWLATAVLTVGWAMDVLGGVLILTAIGCSVWAWRSRRDRLRIVVRESWPVLAAAVVLSTLAGAVLERQFDTFDKYPALLVLVPAFVSSAGALGGILTSRLSTGLHLGTVEPAPLPSRGVRRGMAILGLTAVPIYLFNAVGAQAVSELLGFASPGLVDVVQASLLGALGAVAFVVIVGYYGSVAAVRLGVDPDTYGIPLVTSSVDFVGALALILAINAIGIT